MSDITLPKTNYLLAIAGNGYDHEHITWMDGYSDDDMHAYAHEVSTAENAKLQKTINAFRDALENIAGTTCGSDCNDIARQILKEFPD
jgi:hypothetical protein